MSHQSKCVMGIINPMERVLTLFLAWTDRHYCTNTFALANINIHFYPCFKVVCSPKM